MVLNLPECGRPLSVRYRECELGVDLPAEFMYDLRAIDQNFYAIFHPYQILWDDMVNEYIGSLEDPRYPITENSFRLGELVMGHVLTNGKGEPTPDGHWHIWRWCEPARSWAHIINIDCKDERYLKLLVQRIHLQAEYNDRYGHRGYQRMMELADAESRERQQAERQDLMNEISKANSAMLNRVAENFARGVTAASNPTKETIMAGGGLTKHSKIVTPLGDRAGGLVLPDGYGEE